MPAVAILVFCILVLPCQARQETMEQDTDKDGKPDLWEEYKKSETLIRRSREINLDRKPDIVEARSEC